MNEVSEMLQVDGDEGEYRLTDAALLQLPLSARIDALDLIDAVIAANPDYEFEVLRPEWPRDIIIQWRRKA